MNCKCAILYLFLISPFTMLGQFDFSQVFHTQNDGRGTTYTVKTQYDSAKHFLLGFQIKTKYTDRFVVLDTLLSPFFGFSYHGTSQFMKHLSIGGVESLFIHFLDTATGFIYGNCLGYGLNPFVIRTEDGGITWQKLDGMPYNTELRVNHFKMFNRYLGFILIPQYMNLNDNIINYYITKDGGKYWEPQTFKFSQPGYCSETCEMQITDAGTITLTVTMHNIKNRTIVKTVILQSQDYGASFKVYR